MVRINLFEEYGEKFRLPASTVRRDQRMQEDTRQEAQYDPRNKRTGSVKRIRWSFVLIVLIFLALSLTAVAIWTRTPTG
jgi:hypothetical protein